MAAVGDSIRRFGGPTLAAILAVAVIAGCGEDDTAEQLSTQQQLEEARKEGARDEKIRQLERELRQQRKNGGQPAPAPASSPSSGSGSATSGSTSCGDGLSVGPNTSCPFAEAVRDNYPGSGSSFSVYSSVTDRTYSMSCTTSSPHVCRGGNNATVYFP